MCILEAGFVTFSITTLVVNSRRRDFVSFHPGIRRVECSYYARAYVGDGY